MLIRFVVSNFLSFKEETEFNMLTGNFKIHQDHIYRQADLEILKSAAIYGANGAGKSNLIKAVDYLKTVVEKGVIKEGPIRHKAFPEMLKRPTSFEIEFVTAASSYYYKLVLDGSKIQYEGLIQISAKGNDEVIFERTIDVDGNQRLTLHDKYVDTEQGKVRKQLFEEEFLVSSRPFLSVAVKLKENKIKEISDAYQWFKEKLIIIFPQTKPEYILTNFLFNKNFHAFSNELICGFDTGITKLDIETLSLDAYFGKDNIKEAKQTADVLLSSESKFPFLEITRDAVAVLQKGEPVIKKLFTIHKGHNGQEVKFELSEESEGTQKLFNFIPAFYLLLFQKAVVIFDEIDQSIHSYLLKTLLEKVMKEVNMTGQIIFTTHESNLLDLGLFRQDEIWFANKDSHGATTFRSLSEYKPRYDLDIRKGYLNGRFGAIPNTSHLENFNWLRYAEAK